MFFFKSWNDQSSMSTYVPIHIVAWVNTQYAAIKNKIK